MYIMSKTDWGNATWYLFHTLAEKLRPEYQGDVPVLFHYIRGICTNLPCPTCSSHAAEHLKNINVRNINSIYNLKNFLLQFHNRVNEQLGKRRFTLQECNYKYYYANTRNIILNFKRFMTIPRGNPKLMIGGNHQIEHVNQMLYWLQINLHKFYP